MGADPISPCFDRYGINLTEKEVLNHVRKGGNMSKVRLIAVEHDPDSNLISPNMASLIRSEVLPYIDDECVFVVEGGNRRGQLLPQDAGYYRMYQQLGPICGSGITPIIYSDDPMHKINPLKTPSKVQQQIRRNQQYEALIRTYLTVTRYPATWDEMVLMIRNREHQCQIEGYIPRELVTSARKLKYLHTSRDAAFAEQIQRYVREDRRVYFVGGVSHCIALSAQHAEWSVIRYECDPDTISDFYGLWCRVYLVAELLRRGTA
jgi:hypothetical protein